jgi:ADP-ribosylglycohydrolase
VIESNSFEAAIHNAVGVGGDTDTIACIAGSIAEALFGVPDELVSQASAYLPEEFLEVIARFRATYLGKAET